MWFAIVGLAVGSYIWSVESVDIGWIAVVVFLIFILLGLAIDNFIKAIRTEKTINKISITLAQIQNSLEKIQNGQKEQTSSGSSIFPTLQAFSQLYLDYLAKQDSDKKPKIGEEIICIGLGLWFHKKCKEKEENQNTIQIHLDKYLIKEVSSKK